MYFKPRKGLGRTLHDILKDLGWFLKEKKWAREKKKKRSFSVLPGTYVELDVTDPSGHLPRHSSLD